MYLRYGILDYVLLVEPCREVLHLHAVLHTDVADAGPSQADEVGSALERYADVACQGTDVCPLAADDTDGGLHRLLIEEASDIEKEYYLSLTVDRKTAQIVMMGSAEGGMEIEEVAAKTPEKIFKEYIDPGVGLMPFQTKRMAYNMGFKQSVIAKASKTMECLYNAFVAKDCSLAEINPLVVTKQGEVVALDAKLNFDDSGLYRHPDIEALRDIDEEDPKERAAAKASLSYVNLGGDVACMVNGAGLAMATVDIIKFYGGEPANFLDVGGDSTVDKIAEAFRIMQSDDQVHSVFVNIFGGINKCDVIAAGIVEAAKVVGLRVPVIARLDGTNVEEGRRILREANVPGVHMAKNMVEGAKLAVELAKEKKLQARIKG